jgi:hypothetical protein
MRVMLKFRFPVDTGNELVSSGKIGAIFQRIMEEMKPEAAYFFPDGGARAGLIVFDMTESSQIAEAAERFFFGLHAEVEMTPVMAPEDLQKGLAAVETIAKNYG